MRRRLLEILVDPDTGEPLRLAEDDGAEVIESGQLVSPSDSWFPIIDGVPRFVPIDPYGTSFGLQWNRFATVQLDSQTGATVSSRRFHDETGWGEELAGRWVLDAGCGSGRFAEVAASHGAEVLAVDLSSAVDAAAANLAHLENVHVVQADLRHLPFRRDAIDFVYSIGVLQHTPDPVGSAQALVAGCRPGTRFALTVYGRRRWTKLNAKYLVRPLTRRLAPARLLAIIERVMPVVYPVTKVLFAVPLIGRAFRFVIPVANYADRVDLPSEVRYRESVLDTFDMLSPRYDQPITPTELRSGLADLAEAIDVVSVAPLVVRGTRGPGGHAPGP